MRNFKVVLISLAISSSMNASTDTPFAGQVTTSLSPPLVARPLAVRKGPPTATSSTYRRGEYICAAFPGTTFFATDKVLVGNGETWYSVQISSRGKHVSACASGTTGWMVGKLKDGSPVITVQQPGAIPTLGPVQQASTPKPRFRHLQAEAAPKSFAGDYILLLLGTLAAVILMTWERDGKVSYATLIRPLTIVEFVVLAFASVIVLTLMIPVYFQIDPASVTALGLQRLTLSPGGHILLGFVLSVILMKTVSFARTD